MSRRAKIVCTLGPATGSLEQTPALAEAGRDAARLNFSHGKHADHEQSYRLVREATHTGGRAVAILADLQGPKIRPGTFADGPGTWGTRSRGCITREDRQGPPGRGGTTHKDPAHDAPLRDP